MIRKSLLQKIWLWVDLGIVIFTGLFLYNYATVYPHSILAAVLILTYITEVFAVLITTIRMTGLPSIENSDTGGVL